jgi:hypothetical protein
VKFAYERAIGLGATASSGLPVQYDVIDGPCEVQGAASVLLTGVGSCTVGASQPGNGQWLPAPSVEATFSIANGDSNFRLLAPETALAADGSVTITLANIVGSEEFYVTGGGVCPDSQDVVDTGASAEVTLAISGAGTCTVTVDQNGTQYFVSGPTHSASIDVT